MPSLDLIPSSTQFAEESKGNKVDKQHIEELEARVVDLTAALETAESQQAENS